MLHLATGNGKTNTQPRQGHSASHYMYVVTHQHTTHHYMHNFISVTVGMHIPHLHCSSLPRQDTQIHVIVFTIFNLIPHKHTHTHTPLTHTPHTHTHTRTSHTVSHIHTFTHDTQTQVFQSRNTHQVSINTSWLVIGKGGRLVAQMRYKSAPSPTTCPSCPGLGRHLPDQLQPPV